MPATQRSGVTTLNSMKLIVNQRKTQKQNGIRCGFSRSEDGSSRRTASQDLRKKVKLNNAKPKTAKFTR